MARTGKPLGRPPEFSPELCAKIVADIAARVPYEYAAEANGICESSLYNWLREGREDYRAGRVTEKSLFLQDIKDAESGRIKEHLANINDGIDKWQGQAWILERRWHKHFGTNAQVHELNARLDRLEDEKKNIDVKEFKDAAIKAE